MATDFPVLLRLPRLDHGADQACVLLHVSSEGPRPLDLKLIGTENETVFSLSCKDRLLRPYPWPSISCVISGANQGSLS
jgi:hypothetical protein